MAALAESLRLDGKVAVVIGGTGVLCGQMARALAEAGATTVIVGRDHRRGEAAAASIEALGGIAAFEACDTTDRAALRALVERVTVRFGAIDVLVNGAGVNSATPFLKIDDEQIERIVAVNQIGVMRACQEFGRYFVERATNAGAGASIINIGSAAGLTPLSRVFTYSMTKAAIHNLTKNLAREWGPLGIRVNVLVPGFFPAEQNRRILTPQRTAAIIDHTPLGRFGEPDELSGAVLLLASDAGRFITGSQIVVDGGFHAMTI